MTLSNGRISIRFLQECRLMFNFKAFKPFQKEEFLPYKCPEDLVLNEDFHKKVSWQQGQLEYFCTRCNFTSLRLWKFCINTAFFLSSGSSGKAVLHLNHQSCYRQISCLNSMFWAFLHTSHT